MKTFIARQKPRTWIITAALALLIVGVAVYWFAFAMPAAAGATTQTTRVVTASTQTLQKTVSGTGTLTPTVNQSVNFGATGTVTSVKVVAGATVTAGQALATIDTLTVDANLLSAQASLASAQAKLATATSSSDGSTAATALIAADQAAVDVANAAVTTAQTAAASTTLTAPVAGLVTSVNIAVGDSVSASGSSSASGSGGSGSSGASAGVGASSSSAGSSSSSAGSSSSGSSSAGSSSSSSSSTAAFTIVGTTSWQVTVPVSASSVKNVKAGEQVQLSTTENPSFFGTVTSIGLLPTTTSGAATYPVVVTVTGTPTSLYDGVSVTAGIVYQRLADVLTVPSIAVTTANGTSTVEKVVNGKNVKTTVTVGETVGQLSQITKGLASGDQVAVQVAAPRISGTSGGTGQQGGNLPGGGTGQFPGGRTGQFPGGGTGTQNNGTRSNG